MSSSFTWHLSVFFLLSLHFLLPEALSELSKVPEGRVISGLLQHKTTTFGCVCVCGGGQMKIFFHHLKSHFNQLLKDIETMQTRLSTRTCDSLRGSPRPLCISRLPLLGICEQQREDSEEEVRWKRWSPSGVLAPHQAFQRLKLLFLSS